MLSKFRVIHSGCTPSPPAIGNAIAVSLIGGASPPLPDVTTKYWSFGAIAPAKIRWTPPTLWMLSSQIVECHGSSWLVVRSMRATPYRSWPLTRRPVWTTTSLVPSWLTTSAWTVRRPSAPMPPEMSLTKLGTTWPVAAVTAARPTRGSPLTAVKSPPR